MHAWRGLFLTDDEEYFFIVDRVKDVVNTARYKVWPREREEVIYGRPSVKLVAVVGIQDGYRGEVVKAFVVPKESSDGAMTEQRSRDFVKRDWRLIKFLGLWSLGTSCR
ncbi:MAG: hypothetical protein HY694_12240 [Deltaproteobacteria bacterium]|nr:hypothetical protein [Deltaproteobacteria bacterium]